MHGPLRYIYFDDPPALQDSATVKMTSAEPIDLETFKFEEDLYGEPVKLEAPDAMKESDSESEFQFPYKPGGKRPRCTRPSHKRHPEDAETEDQVLVALVDGGWTWGDIAKEFPGVSVQTLKNRYANMKAKTMEWSEDEDRKLAKLANEYQAEKWKVVAHRMGISVKACQMRARALGLK